MAFCVVYEDDLCAVKIDRGATLECYARMTTGHADTCVWGDTCKNYRIQRDIAFSAEFRKLMEQSGVDLFKDDEVAHCGRFDSGMHAYHVFFLAVGKISLKRPPPKTKLWNHFSFDQNHEQTPRAFDGHPTVRIAYRADIPWLLESPEPD